MILLLDTVDSSSRDILYRSGSLDKQIHQDWTSFGILFQVHFQILGLSLLDFLWGFFWNSLWDSIKNSCWASLWEFVQGFSYWDSFWDSLRNLFWEYAVIGIHFGIFLGLAFGFHWNPFSNRTSRWNLLSFIDMLRILTMKFPKKKLLLTYTM